MNLKKKTFKSAISVFMTLSIGMSTMISAAAVPEVPETAYVLESSGESHADNRLSSSMSRYGSIMTSYLQENSNRTISKITTGEDGYVSVDNYSADMEYLDGIQIKQELPIWGGYYCGSEYNFFLFGQENPDESDDTEVFRVVKYTKDWERVGDKSFFGCNTYIPFDAGTPRMCEDSGTLFIHTSHEMYESEDGKHHQSNVQLHIDIDSMACTYSQFDVAFVKTNGYVSHSFDQYIKSDGSNVYTADHGDAYPRSVAIGKKKANGSFVGYTNAVTITGSRGNNTTGLSLGGFELSDGNCITVGNSILQDGTVSDSSLRNIFVAVTVKDFIKTDAKINSDGSVSETNYDENTNMIWLTDFTESQKVSVPKLVKLDNDNFVVMWNEYEDGYFQSMHSVRIDGSGNVLDSSETTESMLSKCDPIVIGDEIVWYTSNGKTSSFYKMNSDLELTYPEPVQPTAAPTAQPTERATEPPVVTIDMSRETTTTRTMTYPATTSRYVVETQIVTSISMGEWTVSDVSLKSTAVQHYYSDDTSFDFDDIYLYVNFYSQYTTLAYIVEYYSDGTVNYPSYGGYNGYYYDTYTDTISLGDCYSVTPEYSSPREVYEFYKDYGYSGAVEVDIPCKVKIGSTYVHGYSVSDYTERSIEIPVMIEPVAVTTVVTTTTIPVTTTTTVTTTTDASDYIVSSEKVYATYYHGKEVDSVDMSVDTQVCDISGEFDLDNIYLDVTYSWNWPSHGIITYYYASGRIESESFSEPGSSGSETRKVPLSDVYNVENLKLEYDTPMDAYKALGDGGDLTTDISFSCDLYGQNIISSAVYYHYEGSFPVVIENSEILLGDANLDGLVNICDSAFIAKYLVGTKKLTETQLKTADFDQNGKVNVFDAVLIARYVVEKPRPSRIK